MFPLSTGLLDMEHAHQICFGVCVEATMFVVIYCKPFLQLVSLSPVTHLTFVVGCDVKPAELHHLWLEFESYVLSSFC